MFDELHTSDDRVGCKEKRSDPKVTCGENQLHIRFRAVLVGIVIPETSGLFWMSHDGVEMKL